MKHTFKISLLFGVLFMFFSVGCDLTELEDKLNNPNSVTPENASLDLVMNNVMIEFVQFAHEASNQAMPYARLVAMTGGIAYDNQDSPSSFDFLWGQAYSELIPDINLVIDLAEEGGFTVHSGAAKTMKAYIMMTLVDLFGDVPYSEAFQGTENLSPKLDAGADVYAAALALLESAAADLANPVGSLSFDPYYGSSASKWAKLVNTLQMRYYINTRLVNSNPGAVTGAIGKGVIEAASEDFAFQYGTSRAAPDSRHPYYSDGYETGGPSWYLSNYYMWLFFGEKNTEDPRLRYYFYRQDCDENGEDFFTLDCQNGPYPSHWPQGYPYCTASNDTWGDPGQEYGGYWGRDHGNADGIPPDDLKRTAWGLYPAGGKFDADNCSQVSNGGTDGAVGAGIQPIMMSSFVYFMRAEAALTMSTGEDARDLLEKGVRASIDKVMNFKPLNAAEQAYAPSAADVDNYVAEVLAIYDGASDKLNVVMKEYFLALQGSGLEAYNGYRRTCRPTGLQPTREANPGPFARSFWYPASLVNRNSNINSNKTGVDIPVFWDTNAPGCVN